MHEPLATITTTRQRADELRTVARALLDGDRAGPLVVSDVRGRRTALPAEVQRLLLDAVEHLSIGNGVVIVPVTTGPAAASTATGAIGGSAANRARPVPRIDVHASARTTDAGALRPPALGTGRTVPDDAPRIVREERPSLLNALSELAHDA